MIYCQIFLEMERFQNISIKSEKSVFETHMRNPHAQKLIINPGTHNLRWLFLSCWYSAKKWANLFTLTWKLKSCILYFRMMSNAVRVKGKGNRFAAFTWAVAFGGIGCSVVAFPFSGIVCVWVYTALGQLDNLYFKCKILNIFPQIAG